MIKKVQDTKEINRYFKNVISSHMSSSYFDEPDATIMRNIEQLDELYANDENAFDDICEIFSLKNKVFHD